MKKYEIMAIVSNELGETEALTQVKESLTDRIKSFEGIITFEDFWGARGFAYTIKKQKWGYYVVLQFELDEQKISEFENELNIDTKIVRFLIVSVDPKAPAPKKYADLQKENKALEKNIEEKIAPVEVKKEHSAKKTVSKTEPKKDAIDQKFSDVVNNADL